MKRKLVVSVVKSEYTSYGVLYKRTLGNISFSWNGLNFLNTIQKVMDIIYNYNKNLSGANLPNEVFAIRMLQEENRWGTENRVRARVLEDSDKYTRSAYKRYFEDEGLFTTNDDYGVIGIFEKDVNKNKEKPDIYAIIDLDTLKVNFHKGVDFFNYQDAKRDFGVDIHTVSSLKDDISVATVSTLENTVPFNTLSDFYDFVKDNPDGWKIMDNELYLIRPVV